MRWNSPSVACLSIALAAATSTAQQTTQKDAAVWKIGLADSTIFSASSVFFHNGTRYAAYFPQGGRQQNVQVILPEDAIALEVPMIEITSAARDSAQSQFAIILTSGRALTGMIRGYTFEGKTQVQGFQATVPEPIQKVKALQLRHAADGRTSATVVHFSGPDTIYEEFWWVRPDQPFDCGDQTGTAFRLTISSGAVLEIPSEQITSAKIARGKFAGEATVDLALADGRVLTGSTRLGLDATGNYRGFSAKLRVCSPERLTSFRRLGK